MQVSAVIIAGNEELKIADAIRSVDWADEVLVIDSESTDETRSISESLGATVITRPWPGFALQKQFGVDNALHDWIFSLDADERVSPELASELAEIRSGVTKPFTVGYRIPRLSFYLGRPVKHSGWYPDWQLRFFDRRRARWSDDIIHESVMFTDGSEAQKLLGEILHYTIDSVLDHHRMIGERYAPLAARQMFGRGKLTSRFQIATVGLTAFVSTYILKAGFLDGLAGFCIAKFAAHHAYLKHLCLWEMQQNGGTTMVNSETSKSID